MPYALCPMPYALCPVVPHLSLERLYLFIVCSNPIISIYQILGRRNLTLVDVHSTIRRK